MLRRNGGTWQRPITAGTPFSEAPSDKGWEEGKQAWNLYSLQERNSCCRCSGRASSYTFVYKALLAAAATFVPLSPEASRQHGDQRQQCMQICLSTKAKSC